MPETLDHDLTKASATIFHAFLIAYMYISLFLFRYHLDHAWETDRTHSVSSLRLSIRGLRGVIVLTASE